MKDEMKIDFFFFAVVSTYWILNSGELHEFVNSPCFQKRLLNTGWQYF